MPRAAIIIVTFNSRKFYERLSRSIEALRFRDFQLIVWDNGSRLDQRPLPEDFPTGTTVIQSEENLGFAAANNRAAASVDSEFIVLLNPDAFPEPDWLGELVAAASAWPQAAAIGSTQIMDESPEHFDGVGDCYHAAGIPWRGGYGLPVSELPQGGYETFSPCAAAALYRRGAWRDAGGFEESFFAYCEDVDLGFRLRLAGWTIRQAPKAIVRHVGGGTSGKRSEFAVYHGTRNRLWTYVRNMPIALIIVTLPMHAAMTIAFLAISPFRGTGRATWRGVADGLLGLGAVLRQRRVTQAKRKSSGARIAASLIWTPKYMLRRSAPALVQSSTQKSGNAAGA